MSEPFLGEIVAFAFDRAPKNWAFCRGQLMSIAQNQALFSLLGTTFGGDGITTFAVPDLRGRAAVGQSTDVPLGEADGQPAHTLAYTEMPTHSHILFANAHPNPATNVYTPDGTVVLSTTTGTDLNGNPATYDIYGTGSANTVLGTAAIGNAGGNQAHDNMMPYLAINYCISLQGIFPSRG